MKIEFEALSIDVPEFKEERDGIYINVALFQNRETGDIIVLDRDSTELSVNGNEVNMLWRGVYIWNSEEGTQDYTLDEESINEYYDFIGFEYEEDVSSLILEVKEWNAL